VTPGAVPGYSMAYLNLSVNQQKPEAQLQAFSFCDYRRRKIAYFFILIEVSSLV
jgi:hypothetical protein